jgi:hypothetical protein
MARTLRATSPRKALIKRLDALARQATFARDGNACIRCGKRERLQLAHVHTRAQLSLRHDLDNLMTLCAGDHLWWHHHPSDAVTWWADKYPERALRLGVLRRTAHKPDLAATELYLRAALRGAE